MVLASLPVIISYVIRPTDQVSAWLTSHTTQRVHSSGTGLPLELSQRALTLAFVRDLRVSAAPKVTDDSSES
jgi:hypothetical protein